MRPAASLLLLLAGCDFVFRLDPVELDIEPAHCASTPLIDDHFDDGMPCAVWGATPELEYGCKLVEDERGLIVEVAHELGSRCSCYAPATVPFDAGSWIAVEVPSAIASDGDFTQLELEPPLDVKLGASTGRLVFGTTDGKTTYTDLFYNPMRMRWWRLRRTSADVVAEYSADGITWTMLGDPLPVTATEARLGLVTGLNPAHDATNDVAIYRRLVVCP